VPCYNSACLYVRWRFLCKGNGTICQAFHRCRSGSVPARAHSDTGGKLIAASTVNGTTVYKTAGEKLGSVHDVMIDQATGKTEYAIMSFGGFLGIGDSYHPLPWQSLNYDERQGGYVVNIDRSRLEGAPVYSGDAPDVWCDPAYGRQVDAYYGI
jgi:sporulation protein YlmC with PRC-barrel domain